MRPYISRIGDFAGATKDDMTVIKTPALIEGARLLTLRQMLKLEILGMTRSKGRTAYAILKEMGFKGSRDKVLTQLNEIRDELIGKKGVVFL